MFHVCKWILRKVLHGVSMYDFILKSSVSDFSSSLSTYSIHKFSKRLWSGQVDIERSTAWRFNVWFHALALYVQNFSTFTWFCTFSTHLKDSCYWKFVRVSTLDFLVRHLFCFSMFRDCGKSYINGQTYFCTRFDVTFHCRNNFSCNTTLRNHTADTIINQSNCLLNAQRCEPRTFIICL